MPHSKTIFESIKLTIAIGSTLDINIPIPENADSVDFKLNKMFNLKENFISDNDFSDGCSASFNVPTGFYKIKTTTYKEEEETLSKKVTQEKEELAEFDGILAEFEKSGLTRIREKIQKLFDLKKKDSDDDNITPTIGILEPENDD